MMRSRYVSKIINEVVGQEYLQVDTSAPGYVSFLKAHTDSLPPKEALDYEKWFRDKMQFISDFKYCFLAVYVDYYHGTVNFPVKKVVRNIIRELVKSHYQNSQISILHKIVCAPFINGYANQFKKLLKTSEGFDSIEQGYDSVDHFAYVNGHQLVNVISIFGEKSKKKDEFVPLRLHQNEEDGEGLDDNIREEQDIPDYIPKSINRHKNIKAKWGCSIVVLIAILLVVYLTTASLNPLAVYATNNMIVKVLVSILAGLFASQILQMLSMYIKKLDPNYDPSYDVFGMRKSVEVGTGRSADSAICPSCSISVLRNNDTLGLPIVCHTCHVAWHDGPKCYRKGMPPSNDMLPSYPCPNCRSSDN